MPSLTPRRLATQLGDWRPTNGDPLYGVLADHIRLLILDGRITPGTRLPAERLLAQHEGLSRTTVAAAYARLRELDFLTSVRGSGSVARLPDGPRSVDPSITPEGLLEFSKATLTAIPLVADAARDAAALLPQHLGLAGFDLYGLTALRQEIADRYTRRGLPTTVDEVMVTLGAQHAISLVARALVARGDRVLVESPSYPHALEAFQLAGARLVTVPVTTESGWDDDALEQVFPRTAPALAYLMPDFHNPTTRTMPAAQRARVVALAERHGTTIVADETMCDLAFDGETPPPLGVHGRVITIGSVGKSVWGGIRLGWIRAERSTITRLALTRTSSDLGNPTLEQLMLLRLLQQYDRVLDARREQLRAGHALLTGLLRERFPTWRIPEVRGGLTLWVAIGAPLASQLALAARAHGVLIGAGPRFGLDGAFERYLRLPFCYPEADTRAAIDALERAWRDVVDREPSQPVNDPLDTVV
ncbi:MAG: PLP-dependent aminotransferase family protein [Microcella sp.]|uniref:MocR-like transcription factor YczR n=1 Tax=Microcella sp. TaxID=1913979 RepID=UPI00331530B8